MDILYSLSGTAEADVRPTAPQRPQSRCYGCASTFVSHALEWLHLLAESLEEKQKMVEGGLVQELFESGIHHGSQQASFSSSSSTNYSKQPIIYGVDYT
jgi:hypothetical protein